MPTLATWSGDAPAWLPCGAKPGCGKTEAARALYAEAGYYLRALEGVTQHGFLQDLCFEVKACRPYGAHRCKMELVHALENSREPIFVDEADRLDVRRIEDLRDIYDLTGCRSFCWASRACPRALKRAAASLTASPMNSCISFQKITLPDVALYAMEAADLRLSTEACALVHAQTKGNFRRVHNAVLSLESAARAVGSGEVSGDMARATLQQHKKGKWGLA